MSAPNATITTSFWLLITYGPGFGITSKTNSPVAASIVAVNNHLTAFSFACVWESEPEDSNCDILRNVTLTFNPTSYTSSRQPVPPTPTFPASESPAPTTAPPPTITVGSSSSESVRTWDVTQTIDCSAAAIGKPYVCTTSMNGADALENYCYWHTFRPADPAVTCKYDYDRERMTGTLPESLKTATITYSESQLYYQTVFITGGFDKMTEPTGGPKKSSAVDRSKPSRGVLLGLGLSISLAGILQAGLW